MNTPTVLFANRTANGNSPTFPSVGNYISIIAQGVWGGASVRVQASPDFGVTWIDTEALRTADGITNFITGSGVTHRVVVSGASGTTSLNVWAAFER